MCALHVQVYVYVYLPATFWLDCPEEDVPSIALMGYVPTQIKTSL
jgi:hypothetical protein